MGNLKHCGKHVTKPVIGALGADGKKSVLWGYMNFSEPWFQDARTAALGDHSLDDTRREIVASVCFLESYLFEWVRAIGFELTLHHFPPERSSDNASRYRRDLKQKWKEIPKELFLAKQISCVPNINKTGFNDLLDYRHGLVHASASWPFNHSVPESERPKPDPSVFAEIENGWALGIATRMVSDLHNQTGTPCPEYVRKWVKGEP